VSGDRPFVTYEQVGDDPTDCDVLLGGVHVSDIADLHDPKEAAELDAAVAARERKAAAKALREAADMLDERASRARPGAAEMRYGIEQASEWLRARADQVEKGEA